MADVHEGVSKFQIELDSFEQEDIKTFVHNALVASPDSFYRDDELVMYTRKVFKIVQHLLDMDNVTGTIREVILAGTLICDLALNYMPDDLKGLHPMAVKPLLVHVRGDVQTNIFEGIIRIVESHEAGDTPSKLLEPKPGSPEHLVALAHRLAQSEDIQVNL